ncbi:gfo/Idh/MocA family oxidoreductase, partial [Bradyrhizobium guangdongense]|uniref:Gfo/Idh/MocA family protein n=1 Tax=Bradyrhizobium guangdongense TaxID=1325090 RepID=UPI0011262276
MRKLSGVIVGCGLIAREHLIALSGNDDVRIAAVCDVSAVKAEATADRFCIERYYTDLDAMLSDVRPDLVHITTPPSAHFAIAKRCLEQGLNVLCEKPLTMNYTDFLVLKDLANERRCVLMESQNYRYHSSVARIEQLISAGALGDVLDVNVSIFANLYGPASPYLDQNVPHFSLALKGGPIGVYLPHLAYMAEMFAGAAV